MHAKRSIYPTYLPTYRLLRRAFSSVTASATARFGSYREGFENMKARIRQKAGQRRLGVEAGNHDEGWNQLRFRLLWTVILVFGLGGLESAAQSTPNFGPNVIIIDPSMPSSTINSTLASVAALDVNSQFITSRYAVLFKPGTYSVQAPIGY